LNPKRFLEYKLIERGQTMKRSHASWILIIRIVTMAFILIPFYSYGFSLDKEAHSEDEHGHHPHHFALAIAGRTDFEENDTAFSLGLDYSYQLPWLHNRLRVGVFAELYFLEHKEFSFGIPLTLLITEKWGLVVAPGFERVQHEGAGGEIEKEYEFLFRLGTTYFIDVGTWVMNPFLYVDIVEGKTSLVYGIAIGKHF
jgi:hypothetical protein